MSIGWISIPWFDKHVQVSISLVQKGEMTQWCFSPLQCDFFKKSHELQCILEKFNVKCETRGNFVECFLLWFVLLATCNHWKLVHWLVQQDLDSWINQLLMFSVYNIKTEDCWIQAITWKIMDYYCYLLIPLCSAYQEVILSSHMSEVIWYWSITWKHIQNYIIHRQD